MKAQLKTQLRKWIYFTGGERRLFSLLFDNHIIRSLAQILQARNGYFQRTGWMRSWTISRPVNEKGEAIPWLTYPFLSFLEDTLHGHFTLFEFGCGNSTKYYARRVAYVECVEHDPSFIPSFTSQEKKKVCVHVVSLEDVEKYTNILNYLEKKYQIIVVDGRYRVQCMRHSVNYLTTDGVMILDDSLRSRYREGFQYMKEKGFRHINFYGLKALGYETSCTTLFYRDKNCLEI